MAKLFKLTKRIKNNKEIKPVIKTLKVDNTHKGVRDEIESILLLLNTSNRHSSAYRRILDLDRHVLDTNIFLVAKKLLQVFLEEDKFEIPEFNKIFAKLRGCDNFFAIHNLLYDYLKVVLLAGYKHEQLLNFMLRNCSSLLKENKAELIKMMAAEDRLKIEKLKINDKFVFSDKLFFFNRKFDKV
jgi:hypothetical protein